MNELKLDHVTHTYTLGSRILPCPSHVFKALGFVNPKFFTEEGRIKGQAIHQGTEYLDEGDLDWDSLKETEDCLEMPIIQPVKAWGRFRKETGFKPVDIEKSIYHPTWGYATTPDRIGTFPNSPRRVVIEIKSYPIPKWAKWQTAAAGLIMRAEKLDYPDRYAVHLKTNGDYSLIRHEDLNDEQAFLNFLETYKQGVKNGFYKTKPNE